MKKKAGLTLVVVACAAVVAAFTVPITVPSEESDKPGSPSYTDSLKGGQIPPMPPKFGGVIKNTAGESKPWWPPTIRPPKDAPNIVLIMLDDAGYGAESTFGGVIPTPTMDRLAQMGLRYTMFHSASLCSPTRAALITGRNHHSVHFGVVAEAATGYPGYNSIIDKDTATVGEILRDNGYATSWFGKDHNVSGRLQTQVGPFDQWPNGMGFEYFYGFVGGDTSQWQPDLVRNTTPIQPYLHNPSYNLITAMADEAIGWMNQLNVSESSLQRRSSGPPSSRSRLQRLAWNPADIEAPQKKKSRMRAITVGPN